MDWKRPQGAAPSFAEQVRDRLRSGVKRGALIEHATTPAVLRMLGFPAVPLTLSYNILMKLTTGKSGQRTPLTPRQIERLPESLDDPVAIYVQPIQPGWAVLTDECDARGSPILIGLRPHCLDGVRTVNVITTAYGHDRPERWAERNAEHLRYRGTKENPRLTLPGLTDSQTGALETEGSGATVLGPEDLRKFREARRLAAAA